VGDSLGLSCTLRREGHRLKNRSPFVLARPTVLVFQDLCVRRESFETGRGREVLNGRDQTMSGTINPEAAEPTGTQAYEQSDRNPVVTNWGGTDTGGGQIRTPRALASRITQPGPAVAQNAGLQNYNIGDSSDAVQDEAEREG